MRLSGTRPEGLSFLPLIFFILLTVLPVRAEEVAPVTADMGQPEGELSYVIGSQNLIQIKIFGEASVNTVYRVDEMGYITHALVGRIKLSGLTLSEAEKLMESRLTGDYIINPQVTIFVVEHSHFSVLGEVKKPGTYEILGRVSVIQAISMAGGFTSIANQRDVKVLRKRDGVESTLQVDTTRIIQRGDREADIYIDADDVIVVPKSFF